MSSIITNCPRCNAPVHGPLCEYCGTQVAPDLNFEQQKQVLESYHRLLATEDESRRINLLKNGFLPDDKRVLIEAGLRCVPLISPEGDRKVTVAAAGRLKAITSKLRLMPTNADVYHALAEFDAKLKEHERRETQHLLIGLGIVVIAVLIMSGVIFVLYRVLF